MGIYLDVGGGWANNTRFDFDSDSGGTFLRDFIFNGGFYDSNNGGVLADDLSIYDSANLPVGFWTLSDASDLMLKPMSERGCPLGGPFACAGLGPHTGQGRAVTRCKPRFSK